MEKDNLFDIFHFLSKAILLVPIVIFILALFFKFNYSQRKTLISLPTPTIVLTPTKTEKKEEIKIDLKGPFVCEGELNQISASVFIKDKKIKVILSKKEKKENHLIVDDCYYSWDEGSFSGKRICGLKPAMSLVETMMSLGVFSLQNLFDQLANFGGAGLENTIATKEGQIKEFLHFCQKKEIEDKVFQIPVNILFKNKE
ncbi:MAG: hypothetical protein N2482_01085 [Patescibacteria group bacterium]|nr:hypothetical protein [Patescibacteria group bacterium]